MIFNDDMICLFVWSAKRDFYRWFYLEAPINTCMSMVSLGYMPQKERKKYCNFLFMLMGVLFNRNAAYLSYQVTTILCSHSDLEPQRSPLSEPMHLNV